MNFKFQTHFFKEKTGIPGPDLHKNLLPLLVPKHRVLVKDPVANKFAPTDTFSFNEKFQSKLFRVKVMQVIQRESEPQQQETQKKIDEDRKHMCVGRSLYPHFFVLTNCSFPGSRQQWYE